MFLVFLLLKSAANILILIRILILILIIILILLVLLESAVNLIL
jgi:hypothetical protein